MKKKILNSLLENGILPMIDQMRIVMQEMKLS